MKEQFVWAFFSLSGRVGPGVCLLGGVLLMLIQFFFFYQLIRVVPESGAANFWETLFTASVLVGIWCNFALTAKRFHDFGKPTAYAAFSLVAGLILYIILFFIKGDPGPNKYGRTTNAPNNA